MKKACILLLAFILFCRLVYPYTRFGYVDKWTAGFQKHLNVESAQMKPGEKISISIRGVKKTASYSTSDFRIASVTPLGTVYAIQPGTAIISVRQDDKVYKCKITVLSQ